MTTITSAEKLALDWLTNSHVRHPHSGDVASGGINQGYNWQERSYPYVYSEITGYGASLFVNAYRWTGDPRYLDFARQAAEFLLRLQVTTTGDKLYGAVPAGLTLPGFAIMPQYYSFDGAMCLQGLTDLYAVEPADDIKQAASLLGDWLTNRMQREDGPFMAWYDADTDEWDHPGSMFYEDDGVLHAKHAIGLLKLHQQTSSQRYAAAAYRVCDWVLELQNDDGSFPASMRQSKVITHPHCYALEGLIYTYHTSHDDRYLQAVRRGAQWLQSVQNRDGSLNIEYKQNWLKAGRRIVEIVNPRKVTDATAQAARIWLLLYLLDKNTSYLTAARNALDYLLKMQCVAATDTDARGGFYFWPGHPIMFTWATMFAAQAQHMLATVNAGTTFEQAVTELF